MSVKVILFALVSGVLMTGCLGGGGAVTSSTPRVDFETDQEIKDLNSKLIVQGTASPVSPADYLIGPADLLEVKVFESDRLTSTVRVSSRGQITLPLLENVDVNGMTAREVEVKIEDLLKKGGYINNPHVNVFIKEHNSKLVSVVGHVREPGSYEILGKETILGVLARAKGLTDRAGTSVYLTRVKEDGRRESYVVYLNDLLLNDNPQINLTVEPGDVIYVPEAGSVFVEGAVGRPGAYSIKEGISTVSQSITMAGGLASFANSRDVKLVRYLGKGQREVIPLNLAAIRKGEAEDPLLKDRDAVIVGVSVTKRILAGLRLNYLYGLLGIGYDPPVPIVYGSEK